ncbi:MAG: hypothetical protein LBP95_14545 [Deltaproteobacteria bacterium]|jgi:hypothetical protein|nr:hypothetical protein [Deltaproteobacteria bacterium]
MDEAGIFCGYIPSESGYNPDTVDIIVDKNTFMLFINIQTQDEFNQITELSIGTPITYGFSVVKDYDPDGEKYTYIYFDKLDSIEQPNQTLYSK